MANQAILNEFSDDLLISGLATIWPVLGRSWLQDMTVLIGGTSAQFDELLLSSLQDLEERVGQYWGAFLRSEVTRILSELPEEASPGDFSAALASYVMHHIPVVVATEVKNASEELTFGLMSRSRVEQKQWLSRQDARVRATHRRLHGQVRDVGHPFEVAGMKAMRPGGFGRPEQDIGCRCISAPYKGVLATPAVWRSLDSKLLDWEAQATMVLRQSVHDAIRRSLKHF